MLTPIVLLVHPITIIDQIKGGWNQLLQVERVIFIETDWPKIRSNIQERG